MAWNLEWEPNKPTSCTLTVLRVLVQIQMQPGNSYLGGVVMLNKGVLATAGAWWLGEIMDFASVVFVL